MARFIRLEKTLLAALLSKESPVTRKFENRGVQLLPGEALPYVQTTNHPGGIELEDWTVKVCNLCGDVLGDISAEFMVTRVFQDDNGMPQIDWSLTNLAQDFDWQLIYLKITQVAGEDFYSTPFMITAYEKEYTTRFHYRKKETDPIRSIGLRTWFRQDLNEDELSVYTEVSTGRKVVENITHTSVELYQTDNFNNNLFVQFRDMLNYKYLYADTMRCNLTEAFEIPELKSAENFATKDYKLCFDYGDIFDPNYVPIIPVPTPDPTQYVPKMVVRGAYKNGLYFCHYDFLTFDDYTTILTNYSTSRVNQYSNIFDAASIVNNNGLISLNSRGVPGYNTPGAVDLESFTIRITNGTESMDIVYTTPTVHFSPAEVLNGVTKDIYPTTVII